MRYIFAHARVITSHRILSDNGGVVVENGRIAEIFEGRVPGIRDDDIVIDAKGAYLSPGFVEIHTHGAGNADFMDGSVQAVCAACRTHMRHGVTSIVPTTLTSRMDELLFNLERIEEARSITDHMPEILGIHIEGPYLNPAQAGAQDPQYLKPPDPVEYRMIKERFPSVIRWTVAPELPGGSEMGRWMKENGIVASIGHSDAVYEQVVEAVENGYSLLTHFFNGMSRLTRVNAHMRLGVAESGLLIDDLTAEVIADGKHLPPSLLRLIYKVKGPDRICLTTDSMRAAGMDVTESIIGSLENGRRVEIEDGVAYMPDRSSFGGSVATGDRLIRTMVKQVGVPLVEAVRMYSLVPARIFGVDGHKGSIAVGKDADLILFDEDIRVQLVMVKGRVWVESA